MQPVASEPRVRSAVSLVASILVCQLAGALGWIVTDPSIYRTLILPSWAPPGWLFGPVWLTLYTLMGIAAWLVWRKRGRHGALVWFAIQLALNAAWTPVFFGLRSTGGGLVVILLLDAAIAATIIAFARRSSLAAVLLVPYALWTSFATVLNAVIWSENR